MNHVQIKTQARENFFSNLSRHSRAARVDELSALGVTIATLKQSSANHEMKKKLLPWKTLGLDRPLQSTVPTPGEEGSCVAASAAGEADEAASSSRSGGIVDKEAGTARAWKGWSCSEAG